MCTQHMEVPTFPVCNEGLLKLARASSMWLSSQLHTDILTAFGGIPLGRRSTDTTSVLRELVRKQVYSSFSLPNITFIGKAIKYSQNIVVKFMENFGTLFSSGHKYVFLIEYLTISNYPSLQSSSYPICTQMCYSTLVSENVSRFNESSSIERHDFTVV